MSALLSPDGKHLYYMSNQSGPYRIWRMDLDGTNQIPVTSKIGGFPKFVSPDQKQLFFESNLYETIWKIPVDGNEVEKEIWDKRLFYSAFSDDGKKIAYFRHDKSENNQLEIEISSLEDRSLIRKISLAEKGLHPVRLDWLNDNKTLLYITKNEAGYKLWKQTITADSPRFVGNLGKELIRDFSVSPDGKNLIIVSGEWLRDIILIEGLN